MVEGCKTHSMMRANRDGKHTILIEGWKTHSEEKNRVGKQTILIDSWKTHLKRENRARKRTILIHGC